MDEMVKCMANSISFIHAADLHLDSPFRGMSELPESVFNEVRESTFTSLDLLVETAIMKQVDFMLLVGDLFDHERQSLKAQIRLRSAFELLQQHSIQVYLSYGNHDFVSGNQHIVTYPDNVHIFPNEQVSSYTFQKAGKKLATITGFSYENRAVTTPKIEEYPSKNASIPYHIGMLHGSLNGNQEHDTYAPFRVGQLIDKNYDYWALGHIHARQVLAEEPYIVYPGNLQGRHRHESGLKGCYHVMMNDNHTTATFFPLSKIVFKSLYVDIADCESIEEIERKLFERIPDTDNERYLIHVTWQTNQEKWVNEYQDGLLDELLDSVNERITSKEKWVYMYADYLQLEGVEMPTFHASFVNELEEAFTVLDTSKVLHDLYSHQKARKFLKEQEADEVKKMARELLLVELLQVERGE